MKKDFDRAIDDWLTREYLGPFEYSPQPLEEEEENEDEQ